MIDPSGFAHALARELFGGPEPSFDDIRRAARRRLLNAECDAPAALRLAVNAMTPNNPDTKEELTMLTANDTLQNTQAGFMPGAAAVIIKPTVGRVVWVFRRESNDVKQPEAALVTYVHDDRYINVAGFNSNGEAFQATSLWLVQAGEAKPDHNFACWMPYQQGQAAKTEAAEKHAALHDNVKKLAEQQRK